MSNSTTPLPVSQPHHDHHGPPTQRHEVDFQCPVEFTLTLKLDPDLIELIHDLFAWPSDDNFAQLSAIEEQMSKLTDAVDALAKSVADIVARDSGTQTTIDDLNKQIADLQSQLAAGGLSQAEEDALADKVTDLKSQLDAKGTGGAPTPTPTPPTGPTPTPAPAPTPTPAPPAGGEGQPVPSSVAP